MADTISEEIGEFLDNSNDGDLVVEEPTDPVDPPADSDPEPVSDPSPEPEPEPTPEPEPKDPTPDPDPEPDPSSKPEPKPGDEPDDTKDEPTEREKLLQAQVEELNEKLLSAGVSKPADTKPAEKPDDKPEPPKPEKPNFLKDITLDEVLDDPEKFNELLVSVYERGRGDSEQAATEKVLKSIPELVTTYVKRHAVMTNLVSDFYKENPDLVNVKKTVAAVTNEVAAQNPDMKIEDVFKEAATKTRQVLGMKAKATTPSDTKPPVKEPDPKPKDKPGSVFVDQSSRKSSPVGLKGLEKEVNELISE